MKETSFASPQAEVRTRYSAIIVSLFAIFALLRLIDISHYPLLSVDEGLWNLQVKDWVLFHDLNMNGLRQVYLSPLHFAVTTLLFHVLPATCFSVRLLSGLLGVLTLLVIWPVCVEQLGRRKAVFVMILLGLSFTMITINRRAYLESGVMFLSALAFVFSSHRRPITQVALAVTIGLLVLYKSNAVYIVPALLIPASKDGIFSGVGRRLFAVAIGIGFAAIGFYLVYRWQPEEFRQAYAFELAKGWGEKALVRFGRFGIYPGLTLKSLQTIAFQQTDLFVLSLTGTIGFLSSRRIRTNPFAWKVFVWLAAGYGSLFCQGFQHSQYFSPMIIPAAILVGIMLPDGTRATASAYRLCCYGLLILVIFLSLGRIAAGWKKGLTDNPPLAALRWLKQQDLSRQTFLACPEIVAATGQKGYAFNHIFHPYAPARPALLNTFVEEKRVGYIIFDQWETAPAFQDESDFLASLEQYPKVTEGKGWIGVKCAGTR